MSWVAQERIVFASQQLGTFFAFSKFWWRLHQTSVLWTKTNWLIRTSIINSSRVFGWRLRLLCWLKKKNSSANWAYVGYKSLACNFVFHGDLWLQLNVWVSSRIFLGNSMVSRDFSKNMASDIWNSPKYYEQQSGELYMEALSWRTGCTGRMWESHANARSYGGLARLSQILPIPSPFLLVFSWDDVNRKQFAKLVKL